MDKFFLDKNEAVLVIVDIQERLAAAMGERQKVITNSLHLIEAAKLLEIPIIITEQYPKGLGQTVREIREALPSYEPIEKIMFDCCKEPSFMASLKASARKKTILVGMETHVCVLQTALGFVKEGYAVHVVKDAVCSRTVENFETGIGFMREPVR